MHILARGEWPQVELATCQIRKEHSLETFSGLIAYVALRIPTMGQPLGTFNRSIRESPRVKSLRSKLSPEE